jgi:hypothetical protein
MVPTRTASFLDLADGKTVGMPTALSAAAASFPIQLDRGAQVLGQDHLLSLTVQLPQAAMPRKLSIMKPFDASVTIKRDNLRLSR